MKKIILVISHERSGTHFLIDSLVNNFKNVVFPVMRPSFSTVENLLLPHDKGVAEAFHSFLFRDNDGEGAKIFKTHLLPDEFELALNTENYFAFPQDRESVEYLYRHALKIYISRDVRDVMVSRYHYMKSGGGLHIAMDQKFSELTVSQFIRLPNYHIMPCRSFAVYDKNLITYWKYHTNTWKRQYVSHVTYEDLKTNFTSVIKAIGTQLDIGHLLIANISQPAFSKPSANFFVKIRNRGLRLLRLKKNDKITAVKPRIGVIGDHATCFNEDDYRFIDKNLFESNSQSQSPVRGYV